MSAQDYGDLSDYVVNGDNYTRVAQTGDTLVIPGGAGERPIVANVTRDTYWPINNDCPVGNCALFAHDIFTGQYAILKIAGFDGAEEDCLCALASQFLSTDDAACIAILQKFVDDSSGQILFDVFPEWLLQELNLLSLEFTAEVAFDFWFTGCYGELIDLPNLPWGMPGAGCVEVAKGCWVRS